MSLAVASTTTTQATSTNTVAATKPTGLAVGDWQHKRGGGLRRVAAAVDSVEVAGGSEFAVGY